MHALQLLLSTTQCSVQPQIVFPTMDHDVLTYILIMRQMRIIELMLWLFAFFFQLIRSILNLKCFIVCIVCINTYFDEDNRIDFIFVCLLFSSWSVRYKTLNASASLNILLQVPRSQPGWMDQVFFTMARSWTIYSF